MMIVLCLFRIPWYVAHLHVALMGGSVCAYILTHTLRSLLVCQIACGMCFGSVVVHLSMAVPWQLNKAMVGQCLYPQRHCQYLPVFSVAAELSVSRGLSAAASCSWHACKTLCGVVCCAQVFVP